MTAYAGVERKKTLDSRSLSLLVGSYTLPLYRCMPKRCSNQFYCWSSSVEQLFQSKKQAARILGVSERTLHKLIVTGQLKAKRIGRRVLIPSDALGKFVKQDHGIGHGLPRRAIRLADRIMNS